MFLFFPDEEISIGKKVYGRKFFSVNINNMCIIKITDKYIKTKPNHHFKKAIVI